MLSIASSNFRWVAIDPPMMMARRLRGFAVMPKQDSEQLRFAPRTCRPLYGRLSVQGRLLLGRRKAHVRHQTAVTWTDKISSSSNRWAEGMGRLRHIGLLHPGTPPNLNVEAFRQGLRDLGVSSLRYSSRKIVTRSYGGPAKLHRTIVE